MEAEAGMAEMAERYREGGNELYVGAGRPRARLMADLYAKALESERKSLWATCRLKGLAKDTPERQRIAELDRLIEEHKAKMPERSLSVIAQANGRRR